MRSGFLSALSSPLDHRESPLLSRLTTPSCRQLHVSDWALLPPAMQTHLVSCKISFKLLQGFLWWEIAKVNPAVLSLLLILGTQIFPGEHSMLCHISKLYNRFARHLPNPDAASDCRECSIGLGSAGKDYLLWLVPAPPLAESTHSIADVCGPALSRTRLEATGKLIDVKLFVPPGLCYVSGSKASW